jgi:polysaccharide pyruvyl transferase WcaK-like protein
MRGLPAHLLELVTAALMVPVAWGVRLLKGSPDRITVVGWWGSETVGDVAILGQLLQECAEAAPEAEVVLVSFRPDITRVTLDELGRNDIRLVAVGGASGRAVVLCRCLVYGGGPLMESNRMPLWVLRSLLARLGGARILLYSCGIGPLRSARAEWAVGMLLRLSNHVVLRDRTSFAWGEKVLGRDRIALSVDPAFHYASSRRRVGSPRNEDRLALALRFPPSSYLDGVATNQNERLLDAVAGALNELMARRPLNVVGCVMHTGYEETDDHRVYEQLALRLDQADRLHVAPGRHTVDHVLSEIEGSSALVTLRFHGMILALATGTPFVAVDCVQPSGKISAAAALAGRMGSVIPWDEMSAGELALRIGRAMAEPEQPACDFSEDRRARIRLLSEAMHR